MNIRIMRLNEVGSTNTEAISQAMSGAPEGLCVIANSQTLGRGREGRHWVSKPDVGLYFSILLRPKTEPRFLPLLALLGGVAVYDTLQNAFGLSPDIKWPNDVMCGGKKISGILAETAETRDGTAVIMGIGINLRTKSLPLEVRVLATSIEDETNTRPDKEFLLRSLTYNLTNYYRQFNEQSDPARILGAWSVRSTYFRDKPVRVTMRDYSFTGITDGMDHNGSLIVKLDDGRISVVTAGDVVSLREDSSYEDEQIESGEDVKSREIV